MRLRWGIYVLWLGWWSVLYCCAQTAAPEGVLQDIFNRMVELDEGANWDEVQQDLTELAQTPINLNTARAQDLERLHLLTPDQVDNILLYVYKHPMVSIYELKMVPGLRDYEIRDMLPYVYVAPVEAPDSVRTQAKHELLTRVDVRNIEQYAGDPVYTHVRYKYNYSNRVLASLQLKRPAGSDAQGLQGGGYVQLNDIAPHLRTVVVGDIQAEWGLGLVLSQPYHNGKYAYIGRAGYSTHSIRRGSSVTEQGNLHGVGATGVFGKGDTKVELTGLYSLRIESDTCRHHTIGAHIGLRHKQLEVGVSAIENLYSDSVHPYRDMAYNAHYFRGRQQLVVGAHARYHWQRVDVFGELAAAENRTWGVAAEVGCRMTPVRPLRLTLLYRYYSPWYDNTLGYAFSETSRLNDEQGVYIGWDADLGASWQWRGSGDMYRFSGPKYGIPGGPTWGYDVVQEAIYRAQTDWNMQLRLRARSRARTHYVQARYLYDWQRGGWRLTTQAELKIGIDSLRRASYGYTLAQDVAYRWKKVPLSLTARLEGFHIEDWDNRICRYEHDVLYSYSIPALYGRGGRVYVNMIWHATEHIGLYLKVSETLYQKEWAEAHSKSLSHTDIHIEMRAVW